LQRNTRGLSLTHEGMMVYQHCSNIVQEVEAVRLAVESTHQDVSGTLRVVMPASFNQEVIGNLCCGFMRQYPNVDLDIQFTDVEVNLVGEGYDIAIRYGPLVVSDLVARLLFERQPILTASPAYLKAQGTPVTPRELTEHKGIQLGGPYSMAIWPIGEGTEKSMVSFVRKVRVNSEIMARQMARAGVGIAMLSEPVCREALQSGKLLQLLPEWTIESTKVYGVYASRHQLSAKISSFLDFFARHFAHHESIQPVIAHSS